MSAPIATLASANPCPYKIKLPNPSASGEFVQVPLYSLPPEDVISSDKKIMVIDWFLYREMTPFLSDIVAINHELLDRYLVELESAEKVDDVTNPRIINVTYSDEDPQVEINFKKAVENAIQVKKAIQLFQEQGNKVVFNCRDRRKEFVSDSIQSIIKVGIRPDLIVAHHEASVDPDPRPTIDLKVSSQFLGSEENYSIPVVTMNYNWQSEVRNSKTPDIYDAVEGEGGDKYSRMLSDHYSICAVMDHFKVGKDRVKLFLPSEEYVGQRTNSQNAGILEGNRLNLELLGYKIEDSRQGRLGVSLRNFASTSAAKADEARGAESAASRPVAAARRPIAASGGATSHGAVDEASDPKKFLETSNAYQILGVGLDADDAEIRKAYRKAALKWHPDKWSDRPRFIEIANHNFRKINESYERIKSAELRARYGVGDGVGSSDFGVSEFDGDDLDSMMREFDVDADKEAAMNAAKDLIKKLSKGLFGARGEEIYCEEDYRGSIWNPDQSRYLWIGSGNLAGVKYGIYGDHPGFAMSSLDKSTLGAAINHLHIDLASSTQGAITASRNRFLSEGDVANDPRQTLHGAYSIFESLSNFRSSMVIDSKKAVDVFSGVDRARVDKCGATATYLATSAKKAAIKIGLGLGLSVEAINLGHFVVEPDGGVTITMKVPCTRRDLREDAYGAPIPVTPIENISDFRTKVKPLRVSRGKPDELKIVKYSLPCRAVEEIVYEATEHDQKCEDFLNKMDQIDIAHQLTGFAYTLRKLNGDHDIEPKKLSSIINALKGKHYSTFDLRKLNDPGAVEIFCEKFVTYYANSITKATYEEYRDMVKSLTEGTAIEYSSIKSRLEGIFSATRRSAVLNEYEERYAAENRAASMLPQPPLESRFAAASSRTGAGLSTGRASVEINLPALVRKRFEEGRGGVVASRRPAAAARVPVATNPFVGISASAGVVGGGR